MGLGVEVSAFGLRLPKDGEVEADISDNESTIHLVRCIGFRKKLLEPTT